MWLVVLLLILALVLGGVGLFVEALRVGPYHRTDPAPCQHSDRFYGASSIIGQSRGR